MYSTYQINRYRSVVKIVNVIYNEENCSIKINLKKRKFPILLQLCMILEVANQQENKHLLYCCDWWIVLADGLAVSQNLFWNFLPTLLRLKGDYFWWCFPISFNNCWNLSLKSCLWLPHEVISESVKPFLCQIIFISPVFLNFRWNLEL